MERLSFSEHHNNDFFFKERSNVPNNSWRNVVFKQEHTSQTFSKTGIHEADRWQFCNTTHNPSLTALSTIFSAIGPCPWPRDKESNFSPPMFWNKCKDIIYIYLYLYISQIYTDLKSRCRDYWESILTALN